MDIEYFSRQITAMRDRIFTLMTRADSDMSLDLVPFSLKELGVASEELEVTLEALREQNEALGQALATAERERQQYQDLFESAPEAYLITDVDGNILEANQATASLLGVSTRFLAGKPFSLFVDEHYHAHLRSRLLQLNNSSPQTWELSIYPRDRKPVDVECVVGIAASRGDRKTLRWLIRDITNRKQLISINNYNHNKHQSNTDYIQTIQKNRFVHTYNRRELIALEPEKIWLVVQGLVKLTTPIDANSDIVTGLVGPGMVFGAYLTSLSLYQAIALSDVQLVAISLEEIANSPQLAQLFFVINARRLRQTEALLAIAGERHIKDRLYRLLELLKKEMSEPTPEGTRLSVRLTHEDLANACGSTRATITRLMGELQQQEKLTVDGKGHIYLKEGL
ncbi:PAS domain S-box protein [Oscillatoria sp. FACHB-1407]|uniref:PAS domain S-box protein n=1 Tax=Oscillatoria sp. FACHB-1407 TaxID=2692847 RepID=UPI001682D129|nr:PAS domain S-box protein [Oscillatoria sp. FACHB-1407]MBD2461309.1 PAS domain S-box protein [Oscillatoria sp. FACHB-1407]